MSELPILYRDEDYIAIDKPSGLLVHRSEIDRRETRFALQELREQIGQRVYPVHRLDKPTSGVLLFGLHPEAGSLMQQAFSTREVHKVYQAVVRGYAPEAGVIDYALSDKRDKLERRHQPEDKPPQEAVSRYQRFATVELPFAVGKHATARYSWVEVEPETGRKHQIRRHLDHIAHPIIGDTRYGEGRHNRLFREQLDLHRLLLWATQLQFTHPYTNQQVSIEAPLPAELHGLFEGFGWLNKG